MRLYLSSPRSAPQARALHGLPVLLAYYRSQPSAVRLSPTYSRVLIDPGAWGAFTRGESISLQAYRDWLAALPCQPDAVAAIDVIGNWQASLRNYDAQPEGFPTFHRDDPSQLLGELVTLAVTRKQWLGLSLGGADLGKVYRPDLADLVRFWLDCIPPTVHVHGWALGRYARELATHEVRGGTVSIDSTRWHFVCQELGGLPHSRELPTRLRYRWAALSQAFRYRRIKAGLNRPRQKDLFTEEQ